MPRLPIPPEDVLHQFASEDRKQLVVYQYYTLHYSIVTIAMNLRLSERTVQRVLQLWQETGEVASLTSKEKLKRKKILNDHELDVSGQSYANSSQTIEQILPSASHRAHEITPRPLP